MSRQHQRNTVNAAAKTREHARKKTQEHRKADKQTHLLYQMHNGRLTFRRHYMRTGICIFRNRMPVCSPPKVTITRMIQITSQNCNHGCTVATDGVKTKAALNNWLYEAKQWIRFQKHLREALIADDCDRKRRMRCVSLAGGRLQRRLTQFQPTAGSTSFAHRRLVPLAQ